jgi:hypothetical protein
MVDLENKGGEREGSRDKRVDGREQGAAKDGKGNGDAMDERWWKAAQRHRCIDNVNVTPTQRTATIIAMATPCGTCVSDCEKSCTHGVMWTSLASQLTGDLNACARGSVCTKSLAT